MEIGLGDGVTVTVTVTWRRPGDVLRDRVASDLEVGALGQHPIAD